ncbi:retrovirus-related pol polyprotein from transposon TNT 1-94 [Tanacetum coccineum]
MAQPALYDGDEILKTHHVPVSVTLSEEDLELAKITRQKMNDPVCVQKRMKSIPPNYFKENFIATFTPQTQLTPEQVFWSKDLLKQRAKDLKANAPPLPVLPLATMYPPNTPIHLVPRTLPTTIQVNIELRAMKAVFEKMEAEVDQNAINKKCGEIECKNILITNENLIDNCITQDVFYTVTDSALTASRFHDLFIAYNVAMKLTSSDAPTFDSVFVIGQLKEQVQSRGNTIQELKEKISRLTKKHSDADPILDLKALAQIKENSKCVTIPNGKPKVLTPGRYAIDVEPIPSRNKNIREVHLDYIKHLKESVKTLREIVEEAKVERPLDSSLASACLYTRHSQELLEYVIGTCPKEFIPRDKQHASTPLIRKKQVTFVEPCETSTHNAPAHVEQQKIKKTNAPGIPSTGVKGATAASGSKPRSNTKTDRTLPAKSNMKQATGKLFANIGHQWRPTGRKFTLVEQFPLTRNTNPKVLPIKQWKPTGRLIPLEEQCPLARLTALNRGTMLADPQENNTPVAYNLVYMGKFLRSKDETLEFAVKLLKQLQVGLNKTVRNVRTDNGIEFVNKDLTTYYESVGITHEKTVPRTPQHNGVKLLLLATCNTQNRSLIHTRHNKTPYELVHDKKLDLSFLCVFEALCYPTNDSEDLGKLKAKADIGSGLVPNPPPIAPYVPPTNKELEILFQSMFDDYFEPYTVDWPVPPATQVSVNPIDPSVSISVDQDAPSSLDHQSFSVHHGVAAEHSFEVNPFALADNEPFVNIFALDPSSEASSSGEITIAESNQST